MSSPQKKSDKPLTPRHAWQPLTPRGVAAFAHATSTRLLIVQLLFAFFFAFAVLWFLRTAWLPVGLDAVQNLPETGSIQRGELNFPNPVAVRLAENPRLAVVVDATASGLLGRNADLELTFERTRWLVCGPIGCWGRGYPRDYTIGFNRGELQASWGAWGWAVTTGIVAGTIVLVLGTWWVVAILYVPLVKVFALFADRQITWLGSWRLSGAALLPGGLLLAVGILLYGFGVIDLFRLGLLYALHAIAGPVFAMTSPFFLPTVKPGGTSRNPFGQPDKAPKKSSPFSK